MMKGKLSFDINICKGCGLCIEACPVKVLGLDDKIVNSKGYHPVSEVLKDRCIGCGNCALMCPDCVITVERRNV